MKNKKGEIATFLTLGLVLVGGVITLVLSYFSSNTNKKISINSRAQTKDAGYCCVKYIDGKNYGCPGRGAIQNVGKYCPNTKEYITCGGYSSCEGLYIGVNIVSSGTCESYGAQDLPSQGTMCVEGGGVTPVPNGGSTPAPPSGCDGKTCGDYGGSADYPIGYSKKNNSFYNNNQCNPGSKNENLITISVRQYCSRLSGVHCKLVTCFSATKNNNAKNKNVREDETNPGTFYYSSDTSCSIHSLTTEQLNDECLPSPTDAPPSPTPSPSSTPVPSLTPTPIPWGYILPYGKEIDGFFYCDEEKRKPDWTQQDSDKCSERFGTNATLGDRANFYYCCSIIK